MRRPKCTSHSKGGPRILFLSSLSFFTCPVDILHEYLHQINNTNYGKIKTQRGLDIHAPPILLAESETFDIDSYVVTKALDGLFHVLGVEERKIRTNPAARTTDLLKEVFGK